MFFIASISTNSYDIGDMSAAATHSGDKRIDAITTFLCF
jgi:hypothetical protein